MAKKITLKDLIFGIASGDTQGRITCAAKFANTLRFKFGMNYVQTLEYLNIYLPKYGFNKLEVSEWDALLKPSDDQPFFEKYSN